MKWTADAYTATGKSHIMCEDYAIADSKTTAIIVCDGCSSSARTDLGARLLAHSARRTLANLSPKTTAAQFGKATIHHARKSLQTLDETLSLQVLDATLLVAFAAENSLQVFVYGDGVVAGVLENGELDVYHFSATGNAPNYLSYKLDAGRAKRYRQQYGPQNQTRKRLTAGKKTTAKASASNSLRFAGDRYQCLLLSTDGIETFTNNEGNKKQPYLKVIEKLSQFKLKKGAFLQRRVRREIKDLAAQGLSHFDDIGVAALLKE